MTKLFYLLIHPVLLLQAFPGFLSSLPLVPSVLGQKKLSAIADSCFIPIPCEFPFNPSHIFAKGPLINAFQLPHLSVLSF